MLIFSNSHTSPSNGKIHGIVDDLQQVLHRYPRRLRVCADAAVVVGKLFRILRYRDLAVKFNDISVL